MAAEIVAAVVIGGTRPQGGGGCVRGIAIGVLITNMPSMLDVAMYYRELVKGMIIILAVLAQPKKAACDDLVSRATRSRAAPCGHRVDLVG